MTVHYIYRSPYDDPKLHQIRVFDDKTILDWFQRNWRSIEELKESEAVILDFMGEHVYGLDTLFEAIGEQNLKTPTSTDELNQLLEKHLQLEGEFFLTSHCFQAITDDDELELAYYLFDDKFSSEHPDRTAFLVQDWYLPVGTVQISDSPVLQCNSLGNDDAGAGSVYCVFLSHYDSGDNLSNLKGAWSIAGLHLNQLAKYLACKTLGEEIPLDDSWPSELLLLRSQILLETEDMLEEERQVLQTLRLNLLDDANWQSYGDWMARRGMDLGNRVVAQSIGKLHELSRFRNELRS